MLVKKSRVIICSFVLCYVLILLIKTFVDVLLPN